ncbi:hypothetical protein AX16_007538 [Volvariella volvacea WC 439]|nr:hypothetical protein AX16_007538 [Volvariella volvacea WC 439]
MYKPLAITLSFTLQVLTVLGDGQKLVPYRNPIIPGFSPDPSCINVQDIYYCVTSSFNAFPGIPVYASRDLVQWRQIGNVLSRPEQLPQLASVTSATGGIWAPTLRHHNGTFYVTTTLVFDQLAIDDPNRWQNVIFTVEDIWANNGNGWSDPMFFSFPGYDTSLFWDEDGKVYVQGSHYWRVLPAIQQYEIDLETRESLSGSPVTIWTGTGGMAPEGPHIYKKDEFYYLLIAEGGTGIGHMVTMARATSIHGPYDPCPLNPLLTNANTTEYLQTLGHADLFQDSNGNWWSVALATRNATVNFPMGRETILVPVVWEEGEYPVFNPSNPGRSFINMEGPLPPRAPPPNTPTQDIIVGANQFIKFTKDAELPRQLLYFRYPEWSSFSTSDSTIPNSLAILGSAENVTGTLPTVGTSTFIARRQDHVQFTSSVALNFEPQADGEEAGMTLFLQKRQHFDLGVVRLGGKDYVRLKTVTANSTQEGMVDPISKPGIVELEHNGSPSGAKTLELKVQAVNASWYEFSFRGTGFREPLPWTIVGYGAASQVCGGFTGTLVGLFATGNGRNSTTPAYFSDWDYVVNPNVF